MSPDLQNSDSPASIEDILHDAYLQYSLSVNVGRAIPDVRDGLKPVHRRILYAMKELGLSKNHAYTKCAKVVGEVIGNYHPHGDQAAYDTLVRMAQPFAMRHTLVDGQGNFGSIDGDAPAAYRYTECRMERLAEEMLADMDKNTVDMRLTFDEENEEPVVLPASFPNLLVNGATGIGVGMATTIPPHNLGEVIDATVELIDNPTASVRELMHHIKGPDLPTGATIMGINPIVQLYEEGHGVIKVRGKADIEEKNGREKIIITEIPYAVNKERLVTEIANQVQNKNIPGIADLNDESSSRTGIRIVVDVKNNADANIVLNQLYKHSSLASTIGSQFLVVDRTTPKTMNLPQVLQAYIDHRLEVITRRARYELNKAEDRAHVLCGLLIAVDNIDEIVSIIRKSRTREEAGNTMMARFDLSQRQTNAILEMRLHQLTSLATEQLQEEYDKLKQYIDYLRELLQNRQMRMDVVKDELLEVKKKYAEPRRTEILPSEQELNIEDLIARGVCVITVSAAGYIKRVPLETYRTQTRGGVGVMGMQTKEEDYVQYLLTASTHEYILFFTNQGRMHWLKAYEIPDAGRVSKGKALVNLLDLAEDEYIRAMIPVDKVDDPSRFVVMATRKGVIKKTRLDAFKNLRRKGIIAIELVEDDDLIDARLTDGQQEILLASEQGMTCRFHEADCREMGRKARGVRGMKLTDDKGNMVSRIVSMSLVDPEADLLMITAHGLGKRSRMGVGDAEKDKGIPGGYRLTRRGGKGVIGIRLKESDYVAASLQVNSGDEILMTTVNGQMVRISVDDIRTVGRQSYGVRVIRLREGDRLSGVTKITEMPDEEEGQDDAQEAVQEQDQIEENNVAEKGEETEENSDNQE